MTLECNYPCSAQRRRPARSGRSVWTCRRSPRTAQTRPRSTAPGAETRARWTDARRTTSCSIWITQKITIIIILKNIGANWIIIQNLFWKKNNKIEIVLYELRIDWINQFQSFISIFKLRWINVVLGDTKYVSIIWSVKGV